MGLGKYIKKAFLFQWNLLAFAGGMGFALLSGHPDVFAPLVLAGEAAYLGFIGTHPRFQRHVDAQDHKAARAQANSDAVDRLMRALPPAQLRRFQALKDRCISVRQIAEQLREPDGGTALRSLDELQLSDLDRLLWIYLRTLYTQHMLERFFQSTSVEQIQNARFIASKSGSLALEKGLTQRTRRESVNRFRPTSRPESPGSPISKRPRRITSCFRPRSRTWKRRSSRSPSWQSTAAMPKRSRGKLNRSPRDWSGPSRRSTIWDLPPAESHSI